MTETDYPSKDELVEALDYLEEHPEAYVEHTYRDEQRTVDRDAQSILTYVRSENCLSPTCFYWGARRTREQVLWLLDYASQASLSVSAWIEKQTQRRKERWDAWNTAKKQPRIKYITKAKGR